MTTYGDQQNEPPTELELGSNALAWIPARTV